MSSIRLVIKEKENEKVLDYCKENSTFSFTQEEENLFTASYVPKAEDKKNFYDFYQTIDTDNVINVQYIYIDNDGIETVLFDAENLIDFNNIKTSFMDSFRNMTSIVNEVKINFIFI